MGRGEYLGELEAMVMAAVKRTEPASGTLVYDELERVTGRDPSLATIHVTLRRLEAKGLLVSRVGDASPRGGRPRRDYRLTAAGDHALRQFHDTWRRLWSGADRFRRSARKA